MKLLSADDNYGVVYSSPCDRPEKVCLFPWLALRTGFGSEKNCCYSFLSSSEKNIHLFFFHTVYWSFILGQGWLLSTHFCKACQNCLRQSFDCVHNAVWMHELLLCCESSCKMPSCQLGENQFVCVYKIDCWLNQVSWRKLCALKSNRAECWGGDPPPPVLLGLTLIRLGFFGYAISGGGGGIPPRDLGRRSRNYRDNILHTRRPKHNLHDCVIRFFKITNF